MIDLPEWLENELKSQYNEEQFNKIINGYNSNRKTTFRVNTIKSNKEEIIEELEANKIEYEIINNEIVKNVQSPTIFLLENDIEIRKTKIYEEGKIYIQNLSSMIPPLFLNPKEQEDILDMAAAPGGKTTQIAAMSDNKANITASERNTIRLDKMMYNINKQGVNVYCINKNSLELDDFLKFDKILLDAPCTGTGTINSIGEVGEIGGVKFKLLGAEKKGANIFLCPKANYKEALKVHKKNKMKIKLIPVETLNDAIEKLKA